MTSKRKLKIAWANEGLGFNYTGWRQKDMPIDASTNIDFYVKHAKLAEQGLFDFMFLFDISHVGAGNFPHFLSKFEGVSIMSALSMVTTHIGLAPTIATSYADPFTVARQIASLDKISRGRAAWNAITSNLGGTANHSRTYLQKADLYPMHREFLEIVSGLWDTYEDDAFIRDKSSGVFFDPLKMHSLNYKGRYFQVSGPLNISRSVQGRPVIITAGTSSALMENSSKYADVLLAPRVDVEPVPGYYLEATKRFSNEIKSRVALAGRSPEDFLVMAMQTPLVGETEAEAEEKFQELQSTLPSNYVIPKPIFFGTAEKVADQVEQWYKSGAIDILLIRQDHLSGLQDFVELVVPILQDKGIFRREYESNTLRGNLELSYPENRYAAIRKP
ncbi:NtaA/DmoA family FMN-dependent monooxygenase [Paenalcaligenes hominis]|uniref:NtaA/DmoA family FMN-dependent monooxygenase n=1 Tax=Paenalcaligenes hominis TaxID=643674 RepID=UPI0035243A6D